MAYLHLQLLGGFDARDARGASIALPTRKAQALLAYLALPAGRRHSREQLAGLLWGRSGDEQARSSLRQTLSTLRRALAARDADVLTTEGHEVALDAAKVSSDAGRLQALADEAEPSHVTLPDELYEGALLEGFGLREEAFEDWLEAERRRVRELAVKTMARQLDHCLASSEYERGTALAQQLVTLEPLREDAHRALIRLYVQSGRRGTALQQYEYCRQLLWRELGTRPEPETERLASDIRTQPRTEYTKCGDVDIAYQVLGQGPVDLVYIPGWVSHVEYGWEYPGYARFLKRLAEFSRLIVFDKRGSGLSERDVDNPSLEERMDDVRAVLDAVDSKTAVVLGVSEGGNLACLFAASYPQRTSALVLHGCFAKRLRSSDYPWGYDESQFQQWLDGIVHDWGGRMVVSNLAPSMDVDSDFHDWFSKYLRYSASRQAALKLTRLNAKIDIRQVLPAIHVPTLVLRRQGDRVAAYGDARYLADHIEDARFVELPGEDHVPFTGDIDGLADEIQAFVTGVEHKPVTERMLLAVGALGPDAEPASPSTGDAETVEQLARQELARYQGRAVTTRDGTWCLTFDGAERALRCTWAVCKRLAHHGLRFGAGIHIGECEVRGDQVSGAAVDLAERIKDSAAGDQILASRTVKDLAISADLGFHKVEATVKDQASESWDLFEIAVREKGDGGI